MKLSFTVYGTPRPQGSKRAFVIPGTQRATLVESAGKPLKDWRSLVSHAAAEATSSMMSGPISVSLCFYFQRPKSHYGTGKNSREIKKSAPDCHTQRPDIDKLTRAVLDSLSSLAYADDSQVMQIIAEKHWTEERPRVIIYVHNYDG